MDKPILDLDEFASKIPKHVHLSADVWTMALFRQNEIKFHPRRVVDEFEKWQSEFYEKPLSTVRPKQFDVKNNILALTGLTESAKRDTAETATSVRYMGIGTGSTAESESQTTLVTEDSGGSYARKDFTIEGQRKVVNQTAKWGVTWDDGDISAAPLGIREAGLFTLSAAGVMHARVLHSLFTLTTGDLYVVQLNELHANGTL
jgi:hypothetical protein